MRNKVEKITLLRTGEEVTQISVWGYELLQKGDLRIRPTNAQGGDVLKIELKA